MPSPKFPATSTDSVLVSTVILLLSSFDELSCGLKEATAAAAAGVDSAFLEDAAAPVADAAVAMAAAGASASATAVVDVSDEAAAAARLAMASAAEDRVGPAWPSPVGGSGSFSNVLPSAMVSS